ncbi:MAG TPA: amino acid adenylation domain-containing protein, partial [Solirubrobacterales bacterium]|nr:amino acid adenylation domain-containing protein [Solirubrobacterales bacterium]
MSVSLKTVGLGSPTASVSALIAQRVAERPDAIAVEDGETRLTYRELDAEGARIAAGLIAAGATGDDVVAVCLPRSWQAVCAFLGVVRSGASYVPVDPDYPVERRRTLVELAGVRLAIALDRLVDLGAGVTCLDVGELVAGDAEEAPPPHPDGEDRLAYVLFTSGSTGLPKGVEVTHRNLLSNICSGAPVIAGPEDVVLHVVPLGFDLSVQEIWGALVNGARLVVAPDGRADPARLAELIVSRGVTHMTISTGLFHELVRAALPALGGFEVIAAGGDVLSPDLAAAVRRAHPAVRLFNNYGPTEATISAACHEVGEVDGPVPIGRPIPGYRLSVRDGDGRELPRGETGELWIGGPGVARGYRNDPERTAVAFPVDPVEGRMYRTGDRVRMRQDGELLFLGRLDHQVKIDGYRIEPGEVEHVLASHPAVREAAVVVREDVPGHKRLVAYAAAGASAPTPDELRKHLAEQLPAFMVPRVVMILDSLPRNERGKVERAALPVPTREPGDGSAESAPVAELMARVLGLDSVGAEEDFFELGGTSLLAIQLVGRLRQRLGTEVEIGAVFAEPTASGLAGRLATETGKPPALPPLAPGKREGTAPVSAAQRRAWLFGKLRPDSIAYQYAAIFRFEGELDEGALNGALEDLLERHEIFRTSFGEERGEPIQVIHGHAKAPVERVDLRGETAEAWPRLVRARVRARIDPTRAPLLRWTLARLAEDSWALIHLEHHLIHDGWSFAVMAEELAELYSARAERRAPRLERPVVQFQDYARWERQLHRSPLVEKQVERWAARLDPSPPLIELPGARSRGARESFDGGAVRRRIEPEVIRELRALGADRRATLFMVTLAAFLAQLQRYSGRSDLQVGCGLANRRDPNGERLIGMIVNTVAFRCDLAGDPTVSELIDRVRLVSIEAYADADAPFDAVVESIRPPRDPSRSPLVQALFSFHDAPRGSESWSGLSTRLLQGVPNGTTKADLNVVGVPDADGGLTFIWEHSDLLDDADADRLAGHHLRLLRQFAARPESRLSELDLVPEEERPMLARWGATPAHHDRAATVHGLVAERARRDPAAPAVRDRPETLAYGELVARARSVAAFLAAEGVERGDRVGVLLGRTAGSVAAQLGVLAAGAAYVPLDPGHPAPRIASVLADAGARLVLTDAGLAPRVPAGVAACEVEAAFACEPIAEGPSVEPDDLAYVIYTSGSTGEPKGVEVTHGNVVRLVDDPDYVDLGPG